VIAIFILNQNIRLAKAVLCPGLDHPPHVNAHQTGELIQSIQPRVGFVLDQPTILSSPAIFLPAPLEHQFVNGPKLHVEVHLDGRIRIAREFDCRRCAKTENPFRPTFFAQLQHRIGNNATVR
jgi:hypothetical protein